MSSCHHMKLHAGWVTNASCPLLHGYSDKTHSHLLLCAIHDRKDCWILFLKQLETFTPLTKLILDSDLWCPKFSNTFPSPLYHSIFPMSTITSIIIIWNLNSAQSSMDTSLPVGQKLNSSTSNSTTYLMIRLSIC